GEALVSCGHWYRLGEYQIVVEVFLTCLAHQSLVGFVPAMTDELVWCGRALLRLGDPTTAYACFRLATATTDESDIDIGPDPRRPHEVDPALALAWRYRHQMAEEAQRLGTGRGAFWWGRSGTRLAGWLFEHQLPTLFLPIVEALVDTLLRNRDDVVQRDIRTLGRRCGWWLRNLEPGWSDVERPEPHAFSAPGPIEPAPIRAPGPGLWRPTRDLTTTTTTDPGGASASV